jgi:hypothetical protein
MAKSAIIYEIWPLIGTLSCYHRRLIVPHVAWVHSGSIPQKGFGEIETIGLNSDNIQMIENEQP